MALITLDLSWKQTKDTLASVIYEAGKPIALVNAIRYADKRNYFVCFAFGFVDANENPIVDSDSSIYALRMSEDDRRFWNLARDIIEGRFRYNNGNQIVTVLQSEPELLFELKQPLPQLQILAETVDSRPFSYMLVR